MPYKTTNSKQTLYLEFMKLIRVNEIKITYFLRIILTILV